MNGETLIRFIADDMLLLMIFGGGIALLIGVSGKKRLDYYAKCVMAGLTGLLVAKFMAVLYQPEAMRPFETLGVDAGASYLNNPGFPSDHALLAMSIFYAVWFVVRKKWLTITFAIFVTVICVGRVLALVHTPLDIIGGVVAASIGALWYVSEYTYIQPKTKRNLQKHSN